MKRSELWSRILVVTGIFLVLAFPFAARRIEAQGIIEIHGRMAETGGWSPMIIRAKVGVPLHLRLTSDDVMHSFAIGQSDTPAVDVLPGQMTDLSITFEKPGTYTFYCTRWCGPNHWRMRGTIEVSGDAISTPQAGISPLYMILNLDIDALHPAQATPVGIPNAESGSQFSTLLSPGYLTQEYYRSHSPGQAFQELRADPGLASLSDNNLWDMVAYIWQDNASPTGLAGGQRLFAQNCAACHGESGRGNGVFAANIKTLAGKTPADFSDPTTMLGAAPALLQGKILRGGMGTGMPAWGPILSDQQTWDLISYLYSFQFNLSR